MAGSEVRGAGRRRGLMARAMKIMESMRVVDTINLKRRGGKEAGRSGRTGGGGSRGLVMDRRVAGRSDSMSPLGGD